MKKLFFTLGLACLFMVACNNAPKQENAPETDSLEMSAEPAFDINAESAALQALKAKCENWENLSEEERTALVMDAKAELTEMDSVMKANCTEPATCCANAEMTEEEKTACDAAKAEFEANWANFDNMTVEEQKALIDSKINSLESCMAKCAAACQAADTTANAIAE